MESRSRHRIIGLQRAVAVEPRRGPSRFEDGRACLLSRGSGVAVMRVVDAEHDQTGLPLVRHVVAGPRPGMDAAEAAGVAERRAQPVADCLDHPVLVTPQLLGAVFGQLS